MTRRTTSQARSRGSVFQKSMLLLISIAFLSEIGGFLTHQLNLLLGSLFLVIFTVICLPLEVRTHRGWRRWVGSAVMITAFVSLRYEPTLRPVLVSAYLAALSLILLPRREDASLLRSMAVGALSFGLLLLFEKHSPIVWSLVQVFSLRVSNIIGRLEGKELSIGASFSGVHVFFLFVSLSLPSALRTKTLKVISIPLVIVCFLVANGVAIGLSHTLANWLETIFDSSPLGAGVYERVLLSVPLLTVLFGIVPFWAVSGMAGNCQKPLPRRKRTLFGWAGLLTLSGSILSLVVLLPGSTPERPTIGFYTRGYHNWSRPVAGDYGSRSAGMFGNLPMFTKALGFASVEMDSLDESGLREIDVLFMANIDHELPSESYEAIRRFVERGGSFLLLGDHTFYKEQGTNWLCAVLSPFSIRFNFDSANYFIGGWLHSYFYPFGPLTLGLGDEQNDVGSVVGASLELSYPAVPVVVGRYGYSDRGDAANEETGYLGNLEYEPGERLGDVVLAAAQNYGKGKVLVFGDTSGFVNPLMVDTYIFVNRVLTWLAGDAGVPAHGARLVLSLVLLGLSVLLIRASDLLPQRFVLVPVVVVLAVLLGRASASRMMERPVDANFVLVDDSHLGRYPLEFWRTDGLMGLHLNLMRAGYLSFTMRDFRPSMIEACDLLILVAPSKPFSRREVLLLESYVRDGGNIFLCVGYEEKAASFAILEQFGFDIENTPLGGFYTDLPGTDVSAYFREAWTVSFRGEDCKAIAGHGQYPTAVVKEHGRGKILVIGDSSFFHNINLETEEEPFMPNIRFLSWLLERLDIGPESS